MSVQDIRTYEVSVWTLQDDFITVLKHANTDSKGQIQMPKMTLGIDGTRNYEFKIPIYIFENGQRIENPIWYTVQEGIFIENLRKIKVIFNKDTQYERVFEFIITKVTDEHNNDELYCNVVCEGLAFNELGKVGYKISLSTEAYYNEYDKWFFSDDPNKGSEPVNNIDYWLKQFLEPLPQNNAKINPTQWYYSIEMDWGSYSSSEQRSSSIIYDDAYIGNWDVSSNSLVPVETVPAREKYRFIDIEESNIYNITQSIAETFGVFCRYEYEHDNTYHITKRKIVFYNHYFYENEGYLDITYPYSTSSIKREIESGDLVTKMFIKPVDSVESESNLITIMDVPANRSKEDYLLNFDYLHDIETISDQQYAAIDTYEAKMREYNTQIITLEQQKDDLAEKITPVRAQKTQSETAIALDHERLDSANDLLNNLIAKSNDGTTPNSDTLHYTVASPDTAILIPDKSNNNESYYIKMSKQGIDVKSIKIYRTYKVVKVNDEYTKELQNPLSTPVIETDEFGEVVKISNLYKKDENATNLVYLTYDYTPKLYYDRVIATWTRRLAKDEADLTNATATLNDLEGQYETLQAQYDDLIARKHDDVKAFERLMGPALREGYWQPENFKDYGDHYQSAWAGLQSMSPNPKSGSQDLDYFLWDTEPFFDEQLSYYYVGTDMVRCDYPCVVLPSGILKAPTSQANIDTNIERLKKISFLFYDYSNTITNPWQDGRRRIFTIGSGCQLGFANVSGTIKPVLILTGMESFTGGNVYKTNSPKIGCLTVVNEVPTLDTTWTQNATQFLEPSMQNPIQLVYPRIVVKSMAMKKGSDQLSIGYNMTSLKQYEDYYITSRILDNGATPSYFITFKPEALLRYGGLDKSLSISYVISNADISIYLDAIKVLKENAYPKVSYQIDVNLIDETIIKRAYDMLSHLVHINDNDLKFKNVHGYISKVTLDLDKPWEDKYEIKNYRNKFEDLFSSIVAQTAAMKNSEGLIDLVGSSFTSNGEIDPNMFQNSLRKIDLNYAFNHGKLTIDEENGIWGVSEAGVVAFRGGGIFTATTKNNAGNWIWNTGIVPQGINADLITTGQLDTNRVMVYAGDRLRFQLNGDGLFAYKSFYEDLTDLDNVNFDDDMVINVNRKLAEGLDVDSRQFIKMDANGLFFIVKEGALILNKDKSNYITIDNEKKDAFGHTKKVVFTKNGQSIQVYDEEGIPYYDLQEQVDQTTDLWVYDNHGRLVKYEKADGEIMNFSNPDYGTFVVPEEGIKRVAITWDGFTLKNYNDEKVFYADADTGNLYIKGRLIADSIYISSGEGNNERLTVLPKYLDDNFEDHVQVSENLATIFDEAGDILETGLAAIEELEELTFTNHEILNEFYTKFLNGLKDDRTIQLYGSSSVDIYTGTGENTFSVLSLSAEKGVWIGSNKAINLFANNITGSTTAAGASVSINPTYILFGVNSTGGSTAVKMTKEHIVLAAANQLDAVEAAQSAPTGSSIVSGVKIEPDAIWLAAGSGTSRSLVSLVPEGITIGTAPNSGTTGSFIKMTKDDMIIGSSSNLYINAVNVALDTKPLESGQTAKTMFRLGPANDYGLLFDGVNLYIKGHLFSADTYVIDANGVTYLFDDYLDEHFETGAEVTAKLKSAFEEAGDILDASLQSIAAVEALTIDNVEVLGKFLNDIKSGLKDDRIIKLYGSSSVDIYSGNITDVNTLSVISLSQEKGIWIGSGKEVNLFSGSIPTSGSTATGASVCLSPSKILFGVSNTTSSTTAIEMTDSYIIAGVGNNMSSLRTSDITLTNSIIGLRLTKDGFGVAIGTSTSRNAVIIDTSGIKISAGTAEGRGSLVTISNDELYLGSSVDLHINANNFKVSTDATGATGIVFGIGNNLNDATESNRDYKLQFVNGNLIIKGSITATSFTLASNTQIVQDGISYDLSTAAGGHWYSGSAITGTSTTPTSYSTGITKAYTGDMYLNTNTNSTSYNNTYRCTVGGDASTAKWIYASNIKGATGAGGLSSVWYTDPGVPWNSSHTESINVGDIYLNTSNGDVYSCITAGSFSTQNNWAYKTNIKGASGDDGNKWYTGTALSGATSSAATGITYANVGDMYLDTDSSYIYTCTTEGASGTAVWTRKENIQGASGARGSKWFSGSVHPGSSSSTDEARVGDMYLYTTYGYVYKCTVAGSTISAATWSYQSDLSGDDGRSLLSVDCLYARYTSWSSGPAIPTSEITTTTTTPSNGQWTKSVPEYSSSYPYYWRCEQQKWSSGTSPTWTTPYIDYGLYQATYNSSQALTKATTLTNTMSPITTNGISSGMWGGTDYGVILGNTNQSKPMLIGSNSGIHIAAVSGNTAAMVLDSSGIAISSGGTISVNGGSIDIQGTTNSGQIAFTRNGTTLFSVSPNGDVVCASLTVNGDANIAGTLNAENVKKPTGNTITWTTSSFTQSNSVFYLNTTGTNLTSGTEYSVEITVKFANYIATSSSVTAKIRTASSEVASLSIGVPTQQIMTASTTIRYTPNSSAIAPSDWAVQFWVNGLSINTANSANYAQFKFTPLSNN